MDLPVHGQAKYQRYIEYPFLCEVYIRNDLIQRNWEKFPKVNLVDRYVDFQKTEEDKEYLRESLGMLQDLKLVFQVLGAVPFSVASKMQRKKDGINKGIPTCVSEDGKRSGKVDFSKLKNLVEIESEYEGHSSSLEKEFRIQQNFNMQQFLIFNWGEKIDLIKPSEEGCFCRLRKRGLSMKEIELILFVVMFASEVELKLCRIMSYIEETWWSDILNFAHDYVDKHPDVMKKLDLYMKKYVANTFCSVIQDHIQSDATLSFPFRLEPETFVGYEEKKRAIGNDDDAEDENNQDKKKQKTADEEEE